MPPRAPRRSSAATRTPDPSPNRPVTLTGQAPAPSRALRDPGSYRDPSGFIYSRDGVLYRQINQSFADRWDDLVDSGLLDALQSTGRLVSHEA